MLDTMARVFSDCVLICWSGRFVLGLGFAFSAGPLSLKRQTVAARSGLYREPLPKNLHLNTFT